MQINSIRQLTWIYSCYSEFHFFRETKYMLLYVFPHRALGEFVFSILVSFFFFFEDIEDVSVRLYLLPP